MSTPERGPARALIVNEQVRADIIRGAYPPGSPLRLAELAARFDVSMSVVREALIRLAGQRLVDFTPNLGFRVAQVSRDDLQDLTQVRATIEGMALRDSILKGTVEWEAGVIAAHHVLEQATFVRDGTPGTTPEWSDAHTAFHESLISACGSPRLIGITHELQLSAELYRQISGRTDYTLKRDIAAEHRELLELAITRKADEAVAAFARHIQLTTDALLASVLPLDGD